MPEESRLRGLISDKNAMVVDAETGVTLRVVKIYPFGDDLIAWCDIIQGGGVIGNRLVCLHEFGELGGPPASAFNSAQGPRQECTEKKHLRAWRLDNVRQEAAEVSAVDIWTEILTHTPRWMQLLTVLAFRMQLGEFVGVERHGFITLQDAFLYLNEPTLEATGITLARLCEACVVKETQAGFKVSPVRMQALALRNLLDIRAPVA